MYREASGGCVYIVWMHDLKDCIMRARVVALTAIYLNHYLTTKMRHVNDNVYDRI